MPLFYVNTDFMHINNTGNCINIKVIEEDMNVLRSRVIMSQKKLQWLLLQSNNW